MGFFKKVSISEEEIQFNKDFERAFNLFKEKVGVYYRWRSTIKDDASNYQKLLSFREIDEEML